MMFRFALLASIVLGCAASQYAAAADLIPASDFAKRPKYASVQFSPDGERFAALQEFEGRFNLTVGDLKAAKLTRITGFKTYDVGSYAWISNLRLVLSLYDSKKGLAEGRGGGMFAINADGSEPKMLSSTFESCRAETRFVCRQIEFARRIPGSEDEVIAAANERDAQTEDLYRLNTRTGKKTLLTEKVPGHVGRWVIDTQGVPRAAVTSEKGTLSQTFWFRDSADTPWRKISTSNSEAARRMEPAAFDTDGSLMVYSNLESDTFGLYGFDAKTGKTGALLASHPIADLNTSQIIRTSDQFKPVGLQINGDKPQTVWFDEKYGKLQALMDASLPKGNVNNFAILDNGKVVVYSWSDRDPGQYFLYDPVKKQLEAVLRPRDWIETEKMSPMTVVRYKARDGLEIPAYLTLPVGKPAKNLPLVAVIHGGPFGVRDEWGFESDVQFLASRGYAVLQPNYRGSGGYGMKHYIAGFKQWGLAMQDDVTDGVKYLIAQGIVDPARVCIDGTSYGGYATLMALVKEPELFKCGIDEAGVSDLFWFGELGYSDFNRNDSSSAGAFFAETMGDPSVDKIMMEANSPRKQAAKIESPLMIIHAVRDQRVPFQHAEGMRDAMKAAGKDIEWVVYPDEAHGFAKFENRVDRYNKIEAFLKKNIGQ